MRSFVLSIIVFLFLVPVLLFSQESSYIHDWGEVSEDELQMKGIEEDPETNAVILFNVAEIKITPKYKMEMNVHKRIKILTEAGKEYANIEIYFWHEYEIYDLEAVSYSPNGEEYELDDDDIFEEEMKYWKKKVFAIPGVEVGSVIEYRYELFKENLYRLEPWYFQEQEFTIFSEVSVYIPVGYAFNGLSTNFSSYDIKGTTNDVVYPYDPREKCTKYTWTGFNIPGIKEEPMMTAFIDYYAQILFQLKSYKDQWRYLTFAKSWDDVAGDIWQRFDDLIEQDGGLEDYVVNLVSNTKDNIKKVQQIYQYVQGQIKTNNRNSIGGDDFKEPGKVFEVKEGSVNEKNILLINMLNHAGFNAKPLAIRRKDWGKINPDWVQGFQFNQILVYLKLDDKVLVMNAGSRYCPMGYLTPKYNVNKGLLVIEKKGELIDLKFKGIKSSIRVETDATLKENGDLFALSHVTYDGMKAVEEREILDSKDDKKYLESLLKNIHSEAILDSFIYADINSVNKPLSLYIHYHIPGYTEDAGTISYFPIPLLTAKKENMFIKEKRNFPVDYDYEFKESEKVVIQLASSYKISEKPKKSKASMKKLSFNKIYFTGDNSLECRRTFDLRRKQFGTKEYPKLRQIYEKIVNSDQDQVVLVRK